MEKRVKYEYKEMLAASAKRFYGDHCSPGFDSGDISIRDLETGYIYAYPNMKPGFKVYNWGELKPENIAVVDIDGNLIEKDYEPTIEIPMHLSRDCSSAAKRPARSMPPLVHWLSAPTS